MKINKTVEPTVREAFAASVAEEAERFEAALKAIAIADGGEDFAREALNLASAVDTAALLHLGDGETPPQEEIDGLAHDFAESQEGWSQVSEDVAKKFLTAIVGERPLAEVLDIGDIAAASLAIGGWLLSAFLPEGKHWNGFLDDLLDSLEAIPS